jgi:choline-sulfatase
MAQQDFSRERKFIVVLGAVVTAVAAVLTLLPESQSRHEARRLRKELPSVLIISVDSLRADHLGCYGNADVSTPNMDFIAARGVRFSSAFSSCGWTGPSLVSILTGLYPSAHGADARGRFVCESAVTLADALRAEGYAVPALSWVLSEPGYMNLGFDAPQKGMQAEADANLTTWIANNPGKRFFAWCHFTTVHLPYSPKPPFDARFRSAAAGLDAKSLARVEAVHTGAEMVHEGSMKFDQADRKAIDALYSGLVEQADAAVGNILDELRKAKQLDNTIIVLTADHGDELLDHGFVGHASTSCAGTLYDEVTRIPLVISWPAKLKTGAVVSALAQNVDIMPTILDVLDVPRDKRVQGVSLCGLMRGETKEAREFAYAEEFAWGYQAHVESVTGKMRMLRTPKWKLIQNFNLDRPTLELYDLEADPGEASNVAESNRDVTERLNGKVTEWSIHCKQQKALIEAEAAAKALVNYTGGPIVLVRPADGAKVRMDTDAGQIILEWEGPPDITYTVEYKIGEGSCYMEGLCPITGTTRVFGPLNAKDWSQVKLYSPFRIRVCVLGRPDTFSEWHSFDVE